MIEIILSALQESKNNQITIIFVDNIVILPSINQILRIRRKNLVDILSANEHLVHYEIFDNKFEIYRHFDYAL